MNRKINSLNSSQRLRSKRAQISRATPSSAIYSSLGAYSITFSVFSVLLLSVANIFTGVVAKSSESQGQLQDRKGIYLSLQVPDIVGVFASEPLKRQFLAVSANGKVSLWSLDSNKEEILFAAGEPISACAFDPNFNMLAVIQDTRVSLLDIGQKGRLAQSPNIGTKASVLEFAPDGKSILIGGEDGKVYRWKINAEFSDDPKKRIEVERYIGHSAAVSALAYHPFSRMFLSADSFGSIAAWLTYDKDLFGGKYDELSNQTTFFAEDGPRALAPSVDGTTVLALRLSRDGQNLFAALQDGRVEWRLIRGLKTVIVGKTNKGAIYDIQISPNGKLFATVARDGMVKVYRTIVLDKAGEVPGGKSKVPVLNDFKKDSLGYFELLKEFALPEARKLLFLSDSTLIVGEMNGRLLELSL